MPTVYEIVTEKIVAQLEAGTAPWRQPWTSSGGGLPLSLSTKKPYRGINTFLLQIEALANGYGSKWWGTYKQIGALGGQVRKGEKSTLIVFWKQLLREPTADEKAAGVKGKVRIPMLRYFSVFNADQADGLPERFTAAPEARTEVEGLQAADDIVAGYREGPSIIHGSDGAWYNPSRDLVGMPDRADFDSTSRYYSTLFHELTHSTGHVDRLKRPGVTGGGHVFGSEQYGKEELVAEMGAAMLSAIAGIDGTLETSAAYLDAWLKIIKGDPKLVVQAAAQAQRAADRILGVTFEDKVEPELAEAVA